MSAPAGGKYGRDVLDGLPEGGVLIALLLLGALSSAPIPIVLAIVVFVIARSLGGGAKLLAALGGAGVGLLLLRGAERALEEYWAAGPVWQLSASLERLGPPGFVWAILPVALCLACVLCAVLLIALDAGRPHWAESSPQSARSASRKRARRKHSRGEPVSEDGIAIGETDEGELVRLEPRTLRQHALVLGATGSGKTTTLTTLIEGVAQSGAGLCVVDLKGDPELADTLSLIAAANKRTFRLWRIGGEESWNPLERGDQTELMNKLVELEEWSEPHYKRGAQRYLQQLLTVIAAASDARDLSAVARYMAPAQFRRLLTQADGEGWIGVSQATAIFEYLDGLDSSSASAVQGLANRLALLAESTAADELRATPDAIDIGDCLDAGDVVLFSLDSSRYVETASQLAALVCRDVIAICGERIDRRHLGEPLRPGFLVIDEFSAMRTDQLAALIARSARAADLGVVLATQELADLSRIDPGLCDQVLGNTALKIVHRQDVPESADRLALVAGTEKTWNQTFKVEQDPTYTIAGRRFGGHFGRQLRSGTISAGERFRIHPNALKALGSGRAVVIRKLPELAVDTVSVRALDTDALEQRVATREFERTIIPPSTDRNGWRS